MTRTGRRIAYLCGSMFAALLVTTLLLLPEIDPAHAQIDEKPPTPGALQILGNDGKPAGFCPLKHTDVRGEISGNIARVTVTQDFTNPGSEKIEAVYVFPLPQNAVVDDMRMRIGERTVVAVIKERGEARKIYEQARQQGHVAALLDQERPNIFTQSVTNIEPGASVKITISYVEVLKYEEGHYEFVFPMVVGPRYIPGDAVSQQGGGWSPDTTQVPDASKITPPVAKPGTRAGHDISVSVKLDAGVPIHDIRSEQHKVTISKTGASSAWVRLVDQAVIPNRDFILRYDVAGAQLSDAVLTHRSGSGDGYLMLMLQPPERFPESDVTPKEIVFVLDTSGSMSGFPIEKGKQLVSKMLTHLNPKDTFNLITFSGDTAILFDEPVYPTAANLAHAQRFLDSRQGGGGTEMMKAIRAALDPSDASDHLRVVCFVTDGFVGNDMAIVGEVKKHPNARVFAFGIGSSVNRFLLDKMAEAGRGEVEYVTLQQDATPAAERLFERMRSPLLTDISIEWGGLPVTEVYPARIPDVFAAKPVVVFAKYSAAATGTITLHGKRAGADFERQIAVTLPQSEKAHDVLSSLWARQKIEHLMAEDWSGMQNGEPAGDLKAQITRLGIEHRLMTQFTSFVAVEERTVTTDGQPRIIQVPVEMPEGVRYEGVFGEPEVKKNIGSGSGAGIVGGLFGRNYAPPQSVSQTVEVSSSAATVDTTTSAINYTVREVTPWSGGHNGPRHDKPKTRRELLEQKSDNDVLNAWECHTLGHNNPSAPASCKNVPPQKITVRIEATKITDVLKTKLRQLGVVLLPEKDPNLLRGEIPIANLDKLAALPEVRMIHYVAPAV